MSNLEIKGIFSTPIFSLSIEGLSDQLGLENIIREEVENNSNGDSSGHIYQSHPDLHEKESVALLVNNIRETVGIISEQCYQFDPDYGIDITSMWANIQKPGTYFKRHYHKNNIFAGVFYIDDGEGLPPIQFLNPIENQLSPTCVKFNPFNSGTWSEPCQKDTLLIFPAWLNHKVGINNSDKDRLSISFNVMLRGRYEHITSLESAVI